jgi:hypothetical protein
MWKSSQTVFRKSNFVNVKNTHEDYGLVMSLRDAITGVNALADTGLNPKNHVKPVGCVQ